MTEVDGYVCTRSCQASRQGSVTATACTALTPTSACGAIPSKLLIDPYARALDGEVKWDQAVYGYPLAATTVSSTPPTSAPRPPLGGYQPVVRMGDYRQLRTPWHETVLYECTSRLTMRHPAIPPDQRGTYAGMAHPAIIEHLTRLGVPPWRSCPSITHPRPLADRQGPAQLLGLQLDRLLRPDSDYSSWGVEQVVSEFK